MRLKSVLIIVDNIEESVRFYKDLFGLQVILKQECNVIMSEGLVLQDVDVWYDSTQIPTTPHNNMTELYFEKNDMEGFIIDMKEKGMSKGEFNSVAQVNGGLENMINWDGKDKDLLALIKYTADEDKLEKVLENPQVLKTPVVRNGKQSTLGYQPDIWKGWN